MSDSYSSQSREVMAGGEEGSGLLHKTQSTSLVPCCVLDWTGLDWFGLACGAPSLGPKSDHRWYRVQPGSGRAEQTEKCTALEGARGKPASFKQDMDRVDRVCGTTTRFVVQLATQAQAQAQAHRLDLTEVCVP